MTPTRARDLHRRDERFGPTLAERVEQVLRSRGLTLAEVSRQTALRYARTPHHSIPHNFYYDLGLPGYSPKIEQVLALSRISNYRLGDWLSVFGFDLQSIPQLQAEFPAERTSLVDSTLYDQSAWIPWLEDAPSKEIVPALSPLGQLLTPSRWHRAEFFATPTSRFLYAKVGGLDTWAFPDLSPGSIVRADTRGKRIPVGGSERLFLVEHARGLACCRLHTRTRGRVALLAESLPYPQPELRLGSELRILGVLDWELRFFKTHGADVPLATQPFLEPQGLVRPTTLGQVLQRARTRGGFSFRNASAKSRSVAEVLDDPRYFCAPGSLADYEKKSRLPAHIHKIVSVSILYSIGFWELLRTAGIPLDDVGHEAIPDTLVGRTVPESHARTEDATRLETQPGFLGSLIREFEEVPLFLRHSLSALTDLPAFSLRDVFWTGGRSLSFHPLLRDAVFVSVNPRLKKPVVRSRKPVSEQPLYVLLMRDASYQLVACSARDGVLLVHTFTGEFPQSQRLRQGVDAEVVGKVTAIFRRLR